MNTLLILATEARFAHRADIDAPCAHCCLWIEDEAGTVKWVMNYAKPISSPNHLRTHTLALDLNHRIRASAFGLLSGIIPLANTFAG